ncbi:hypothetical protein N9263_01310, partial [Candidatus Marinimicrobia bacterium]|nr:hypothetical protein [Candidatus Neomarinimicrobiota bacterium]
GFHLATLFPLASLVEAGVVFQFKNEFNARVLVPLLSWLITKQDKYVQYIKEGGKKLKFYGYSQYPLKALNEMRKMTNDVRPRLSKVKCPTMLVHSRADLTSIFENYHIVKNNIASKKQIDLILEKSSHSLFSKGIEQTVIFKKMITFMNENSTIQ